MEQKKRLAVQPKKVLVWLNDGARLLASSSPIAKSLGGILVAMANHEHGEHFAFALISPALLFAGCVMGPSDSLRVGSGVRIFIEETPTGGCYYLLVEGTSYGKTLLFEVNPRSEKIAARPKMTLDGIDFNPITAPDKAVLSQIAEKLKNALETEVVIFSLGDEKFVIKSPTPDLAF